MIADLVFYNENYSGDIKIPASLFPIWERRAETELMHFTGGKINGRDEECVKLCLCEMAELLYKQENLTGIRSENNDGYVVSYQERDIKKELLEIAKSYLSETDFLYRGVE